MQVIEDSKPPFYVAADLRKIPKISKNQLSINSKNNVDDQASQKDTWRKKMKQRDTKVQITGSRVVGSEKSV